MNGCADGIWRVQLNVPVYMEIVAPDEDTARKEALSTRLLNVVGPVCVIGFSTGFPDEVSIVEVLPTAAG